MSQQIISESHELGIFHRSQIKIGDLGQCSSLKKTNEICHGSMFAAEFYGSSTNFSLVISLFPQHVLEKGMKMDSQKVWGNNLQKCGERNGNKLKVYERFSFTENN